MPKPVKAEALEYASSIDGLAPLRAQAWFRPNGVAKPLVAVLHGFHGSHREVIPDCEALAHEGIFCVAPDMRGHGKSAGKHDCGALQICDIVDALRVAAERFPEEVDLKRVSAVGYSGGGGNVLSLATKFPELLQAGAAFFGISDYDLWYRTGGRPDCNATMDAAIGGSPDQYPLRYQARSSLRAVRNNPHTVLHLFWDEEETHCPPMLNEWFVDASRRLGHANVHAHLTHVGDAIRWHHGYRSGVEDLYTADAIFVPDLLATHGLRPLPAEGVLDVCGYVVTTRFAVWLGEGTSGSARAHYDVSGSVPRVSVSDLAGDDEVRILPGTTLLGWLHPEG